MERKDMKHDLFCLAWLENLYSRGFKKHDSDIKVQKIQLQHERSENTTLT